MSEGILLVDKPAGLTSHDVVARLRRIAGTRRVGHAGTLDPMATGLLVLGVGRATRLLTHLVGADKTYTATVRLGATTVTDDAEGEVLARTPVGEAVDDAAIAAAVAGLTGDIQQVPSAVSAIKVNGRRAYARVRAGEQVALQARPVTVRRFDVVAARRAGDQLDLDVVVECSSGTYIRALARDLGEALGVGGHLTALRRTVVGPFTVAEAQTLAELGSGPVPLLSMAEAATRALPSVRLDERTTEDLRHGRPIPAVPGPAVHAALGPDGRLVALVENRGERARALAVLDPAQNR